MEKDHAIRPFVWTLIAICYLVTIGALLAAFGHYPESIGIGTIVVGLIGVIKIPTGSVTIDNKETDPVPVTKAGE